jgi:hypothetical protein
VVLHDPRNGYEAPTILPRPDGTPAVDAATPESPELPPVAAEPVAV